MVIIIGNSCLIILLYGLQSWVPTMLLRVYEWDLIQSGRVYGLIAMLAGSAGVLSGPIVLRLMSKNKVKALHFCCNSWYFNGIFKFDYVTFSTKCYYCFNICYSC